MRSINIAVIGGGAAGFFCAVNAARLNPDSKVTIYEQSSKLLSKVKISGGGRCNVTHNCFDNIELSKSYPRGERELRSAFSRFNVKDTIEWFKNRGVELKTEDDGRMFPVTDNSQTIIDCLLNEAEKYNVKIKKESKIVSVQKEEEGFSLYFISNEKVFCDKLVIAAGGHPNSSSYEWIKKLGHTIVSPVPSLFTFNVPDNSIINLPGVSVPEANIKVLGTKLTNKGPLLITHWGFSGPAILKLSAIGAEKLHELNYSFKVSINWLGNISEDEMRTMLTNIKSSQHNKNILAGREIDLPKRLWEHLILKVEIGESMKWADVPQKSLNKLAAALTGDIYEVKGKTTFKEEFVTCGGVALNEIDFKTMESRKCKGLYFAGEVLNIDGITGGFNFQNAWTTGRIAANAMSSHL